MFMPTPLILDPDGDILLIVGEDFLKEKQKAKADAARAEWEDRGKGCGPDAGNQTGTTSSGVPDDGNGMGTTGDGDPDDEGESDESSDYSDDGDPYEDEDTIDDTQTVQTCIMCPNYSTRDIFVANCRHRFCRGCLEARLGDTPPESMDASHRLKCPHCDVVVKKVKLWADWNPAEDVPPDFGDEARADPVFMRVSSKCIILASPVFRAMLQINFSEGHTLATTGSLDLPLPEDDPHALSLLMDIVHLRTGDIPEALDLRHMTAVAILVDKYQLHVAVKFHASVWMRNFIEGDRYSRYDRRPRLTIEEHRRMGLNKLIIFYLFKQGKCFEELTRELIGDHDETFWEVAQDYPIPSKVIDAAKRQRLAGIESIMRCIEERYKRHKNHCRRRDGRAQDCDTHSRGVLLEWAHRAKISPRPEAPYPGLSMDGILRTKGFDLLTTLCYHDKLTLRNEGGEPSESMGLCLARMFYQPLYKEAELWKKIPGVTLDGDPVGLEYKGCSTCGSTGSDKFEEWEVTE